MKPTILNLTRTLAVLLAWSLASASVQASGWNLRGDAAPAPRKELLWGLPRDDPAIAVGAIVAALVLFVAVAWVGSRVGDKS